MDSFIDWVGSVFGRRWLAAAAAVLERMDASSADAEACEAHRQIITRSSGMMLRVIDDNSLHSEEPMAARTAANKRGDVKAEGAPRVADE